MEGRPPSFNFNEPESWPNFIEDLTLWFDAKGITQPAQKRGLLCGSICEETKRRLKEWIHPRSLTLCTYDELQEIIEQNIRPTVNQGALFNCLVCRFQKATESGAQYLSALNSLAVNLGFGWHTSKLVLFQFKRGLLNKGLQEQLYSKSDIDVTEALALVTAAETSKQCVRQLQQTEEVMALSYRQQHQPSKGHRQQPSTSRDSAKPTSASTAQFCFRCGETDHLKPQCTLKFKNCKCNFCKGTGHLEKACLKKRDGKTNISVRHLSTVTVNPQHACQTPPNCNQPPPVVQPPLQEIAAAPRQLNLERGELELRGPVNCEDVFCDLYAIAETDADLTDNPIYITLMVENMPIKFQVDNGASRTSMAMLNFQKTFGPNGPKLRSAPLTLFNWGGTEPLASPSQTTVSVQFGERIFMLPLLVSPVDPAHAPTVMGRDWINAFYGKDFFNRTMQISKYSVNLLHSPPQFVPPSLQGLKPSNLSSWIAQFPTVNGKGTGRFRGEPVSVTILPDSQPKYYAARQVAFALTTRVEEAIDRNVAQGIWIPVKYSAWATPIVPVPKKNGTTRLCGDYKSTLNPVIKSDTHKSPSVDEVLAAASGCCVFAELDAKEAYLQVPVTEETSMLMTVNTSKGLFRPTTLQYGIKVAPGTFQRIMDGLLGGIKGVKVYQDNIYIFSPSLNEHYKLLSRVLTILSDAGIRLNTSKCTWVAQSLEVLGFLIDKEGVHPTPDKYAAIKAAPAPEAQDQLQSLLGLISFYGRFFHHKATHFEPLHRLLDSGTIWQWTDKHQKALEIVKAMLTSNTVMVHYSLKLPLILVCDASSYGVGAVLLHLVTLPNGKQEERPIYHASRTLNQAERNYSQLDREALSLVFGVSKFYQYVYGRHFTLVTDHKPLLGLLSPNSPLPIHMSPRFLRWALQLGCMDFTLQYRPGKKIANADFLSRCPLPEAPVTSPEPAGILLLEDQNWTDISSRDIARETAADPTLQSILHWTKNGWPKQVDGELKPYWEKRSGISTMKECLLWGDRVIIPQIQQSAVLKLIHASHYGISYSKAIARSLVWWPRIDEDVANTVRTCQPCQLSAKRHAKPLVTPWPKATAPWERVHIDYAGPIDGHNFLIITDAYSQYSVIKVVPNLSTATLITHMRYFFADYGLPCLIVSDNGRQLVSQEFKQFLKKNGVRHITSPPWHPSSNGLAERTVQTFKALLARFTQGDIHTRVARVTAAMRNRPTATGQSPAEIIGRPGRHPLSRLHPNSDPARSYTDPTIQEGTCVWALKRSANTVVWVPGVVESAQGGRVLQVRLEADGSLLRVSPDEVRLRFLAEWPEQPVPTPPEAFRIPVGQAVPLEQRAPEIPVVQPQPPPEIPQLDPQPPPEPPVAPEAQPVPIPEAQPDPVQQQDPVLDLQQAARTQTPPRVQSPDRPRSLSPPQLSPQARRRPQAIVNPAPPPVIQDHGYQAPRGIGRGDRGRPRGSKNRGPYVPKAAVTRSGRYSKPPSPPP